MILKNSIITLFLSLSSVLFAQKTVTGNVSAAQDGPLPGATIIVKGSDNTGTLTDFDGNFSVSASIGDVLIVSYVGFASQEVSIANDSTLSIVLESDQQLDEVVVTALGISREKKSLGYAVTQVSGENLNTVKDNNLASSLTGKVAGLQISQSGSLGSASRITIRGNNSLGGNSQALIIVDGMPINASLPISGDGSQISSGSSGVGGGPSFEPSISGGGISDINPDDVESISVLKGPSAAALYGSRAGNGVILITTKKGKRSDELGVKIKTDLYVDNPLLLPEYQNQYGQGSFGAAYTDRTNDWGELSWGSVLDGSQQAYYDGTTKAYRAQSDNVKNFFRQAVRRITSISMDKGSENSSFRFSYTNNQSEAIVENSDLNSHNFNLRSITNLSDKLTLDAKATYFTQIVKNRSSTTGAQGLLGYVYNMPRNVAVDDLRNYQMDNPATPSDFAVIRYADGNTGNPFWQVYNDENTVRRNRFLGYTKIDYKFTDWLSAFVRVGADVTNIRDIKIFKPGHHFVLTGSMNIGESTFNELNSEFLVTAQHDFSDKLNVVANVGGNLSRRTAEGMTVAGTAFKIPTAFFINNLEVLQSPQESPLSIKKVNSLYGAANLAYENFLYLDVSVRNDWSSTLSEENRSFMYSSASLSAILNKFIDPSQKIFNLIKLRGSFAEVGNDTDPYQLNQTYNVPGQGYLGLTTLQSPTVKLNSDLKPENIASSEFGLELAMLNNKLSLDVSVYNVKTTDLIFDVPVPAATGYQFNRTNIGEVTNKGLEIVFGANLLNTADFSWDTSFFYSKNENKIVELVEGVDRFSYVISTDSNVSISATEGGSIGDIYGRVWTGEVNSDGVPIGSAAPDVLLGNAQPDWKGGWSNTIKYKDLSLRFLIDARMGGQIYSQTSADLDRNGVSKRSLQYRESGVVVNGTNTGTGSANTQSITGQQYWTAMSNISENYIYDQDNIRLRELALAYNIPLKSNKLGLQNAMVQLVGRNLFFFMNKADDIDPETMLGTSLGVQGLSQNAMPTLRSVGLNLNLTF
ncbi:SusC/RagA family TonB-linked outer membrane protein [Flavobacteriaceae bacterium]|nr:SusC/RagA family TonB-linked outer membrane protein [Flavobacteriaceae bacterium]MDB4113255.1 SusC/RagA family TonB-linked outer membrane protein [Flavobacteriaceae bacterium]MDB4186374.1 SusC/RagA family TonB-linked outer membrane protein [Flavobacteriaceae bacterium]MDC0013984.1 SusC/RagA family TonB-linked outer membrane protein [Flavobacteriaceae bacterium]